MQKVKVSCTHCKKEGHDDEHCWILHPEMRSKKSEGKKKKIVAAIQRDFGSDSRDETTTAATGIKGKNYEASTSFSQSIIDEENERKDMSFSIFELFPKIKRLILCLIVALK